MKKLLMGLVLCGFASVGFTDQPLMINKEVPDNLNTNPSGKMELPTLDSKILPVIPDVDVVFGIKLGAKRDKKEFPNCNYLKVIAEITTCYMANNIILSKKEAPDYIKDRYLYIFAIDKKAEKIQFQTNGYQDQEKVLNILIQKYGKPSFYRNVQSSNAFNRTITSPEAIWRFGDIEIMFWGTLDRIDKGGVSFTTKKYRELEEKKQTKKKIQQRSL